MRRKGPLQAAVDRFHPGMLNARPVLLNSRPPRDNETHGKHFYFLPRALITALHSSQNFVVSPVRSDWQAIDLSQVEELLASNRLVFAEVYYTFGPTLKECARHFAISTVFLLPVPLVTPAQEIINTMRAKLKARATDSENKIEERAQLAPQEMKEAESYTHHLLNLATEDNIEEWGDLGTRNRKRGERIIRTPEDLGPNAKWLVETFLKILRGELPPGNHARPTV